jgi:hypothetical protein
MECNTIIVIKTYKSLTDTIFIYYTQTGGLGGPNTKALTKTSSSFFNFHRHNDWGIRMP